ncbi:hypothetical protein RJ640_013444 [Escallonia rubra]|uniref:HhH-GPD domain-containing protein n=1 Tax=Escallonia rubra TaxID=112253 RepID=A0AA88RKB3_9ASTE|nr:hypothetical protein RJ640_013444 [Escallonia rubra]
MRRKKHRPKVVIEGKPRRSRKPAATDGSSPVKRKYVRKKDLHTAETEQENVRSEAKVPTPEPVERSCGRGSKFDRNCGRDESLDRTSTHQEEMCDNTKASIDPVNNTPNVNPSGKRKYVGRKSLKSPKGAFSPKSNTQNVNSSTGKRKYVRKKSLKGAETQQATNMNEATVSSVATVERACTVCESQDNIIGHWAEKNKESTGAFNPKNSTPNVRSSGKRKYVRKKGLNIAETQQVSLMNEVKVPTYDPVTIKRSCRRSLNFDLECGRRDESQERTGSHKAQMLQESKGAFDFDMKLQGRELCAWETSVSGTSSLQRGQSNGYVRQNIQAGFTCNFNQIINQVPNGYMSLLEQFLPLWPPAKFVPGDLNIGNANLYQEPERKDYRTMNQYTCGEGMNEIAFQVDTTSLNIGRERQLLSSAQLVAKVMANFDDERGLKRDCYHTIEQTQTPAVNLMGSLIQYQETGANQFHATTTPKGWATYDCALGFATLDSSKLVKKQDVKPWKSALDGHQQLPRIAKGRRRKEKLPVSVDEITCWLEGLNINAPEQHALVPFKRGRPVDLYKGSDPNKKKKRRPKADLDPQTERIWKLLMWKEGSEGSEATHKGKEKYWEEEREVYRGRAESFIARMHLVQGDRRFSKWKGSVLDSVIGVYLTQNVSDHLSSSAFMSLAARFPIKLATTNQTSSPNANIVAEEPDWCMQDRHGSVISHEKTGTKQVCDTSSISFREALEHIKHNPSSETSRKAENEHKGISDEEIVSSQNLFDSLLFETSGGIKSTYEAEDLTSENPEREGQIPRLGSVNNLPGSSTSSPIGPNNGDIGEFICSSSNSQLNTTPDSGLNDGQSLKVLVEESISSLPSTGFGITMTNIVNHVAKGMGDEVENMSEVNAQNSRMPMAQTHHAENNIHGISIPERTFHAQERPAEAPVRRQSGVNQPLCGDCNSDGQTSDMEEGIDVSTQDFSENKATEVNAKVQSHTADTQAEGLGTNTLKTRNGKAESEKKEAVDWDRLRKRVQSNSKQDRNETTDDSIDYEALRHANVKEIADTIKERGMNNVLAQRMKGFLNRLVEDHGSIDLEWLRDCPPDDAKDFLLGIRGLGLKSVECVRLLTLHHLAFPVDTNVGRIAVRLGWVPLQPLPESLQLHLLELARLALRGPEERSIVSVATDETPEVANEPMPLLPPGNNSDKEAEVVDRCLEPIIEEPTTPEQATGEVLESDIEDAFYEDPTEIPTIKLNIEEFTVNLQHYMQGNNIELQNGELSKALVALNPEAASIPTPKLKDSSRLRTEHLVYELPDSHPLVKDLDKRDSDDPSPYLLAIWTPGETANSFQPPEIRCQSQESGKLCNEHTCFSCNNIREENSQTVRGTLLIPCRTAMQGSFPLNGTYFQVNEMFADHASSLNPIDVPRAWIWNLPRRTVYFGTSMPTIFRGKNLASYVLTRVLWEGFVCVRGFDRETRAPRPLMARLHYPASKVAKAKKNQDM